MTILNVRAAWLATVLLAAAPALAQTPPQLHLLAAGSLTAAMTEELAASGLPPQRIAPPVFGPSGHLRETIQQGAQADIFASADIQQPRLLAVDHPSRPVILFARNRMCALARADAGITAETLLDRMLDPKVRLATSTPVSDPGGDYAWQVFARAETVHPGAQAALQAKAMPLVGGPDSKPFVPGKGQVQGVFLADKADIMLGYCSGSPSVMADVPGLVSIPLPQAITVRPAYGMVILSDQPLAARFAAFVMSEPGQAILARHGFVPVAMADPGAAPIILAAPGMPPAALTDEALAALPSITLPIQFDTEHGPSKATFEGPLLWTVLDHAGALKGPASGQVRRSLTITGADGYTAVLGLGEISPAFEGKQVILARSMNGKPLPPGQLRIVVPGDKHGGRSVRDVTQISIH